jgi:glycosyltransferase involved in cell wall biosynthesis
MLTGRMVDAPKISVIMPSYGKADFIGEAIESVLGQTLGDLELIVVDDCSVDGSRGIAEAFTQRDRRVRLITKPMRTGVSSSINIGIRTSRGEAVSFIGSDDVYSPVNLEKLWTRMKAEPVTTVVYSDRWKLDADGNLVPRTRPSHSYESGWIFGDLLARGFGHITTTLIPRVCFEKVGVFDESLKWAEDYELALRLARDYPFAFIPEKLYGYRVYPGNMRNTIDRIARLKIQSGILEKYVGQRGALLSREQRRMAEGELLRFYWETGQRSKAFSRGLRSASGIRSIVRYSRRSLLRGIRSETEED